MSQKLPVYDLSAFQQAKKSPDFYANWLKPHVATHTFTNLPHKHDFYLVLFVTRGSGIHEIDFEKYPVSPGSLFILKPGQMHFWKLSADIDGYVFFHSRAFFEAGFALTALQDFPFYNSSQATPALKIPPKNQAQLQTLLQDIVEENNRQQPFKTKRLQALVTLAYIAASRNYEPGIRLKNQTYLTQAAAFEALIETHFKTLKSAREFASRLNISEKHLNRITRACFNKTSTRLIAERIVLEAKRMLIHTRLNVSEIADILGYADPSYFTRFFKKNTGETPLMFLNHYKQQGM